MLASMTMAKDVAAVTMPALGLDHMPALGYSVSKAARNMLAVQYALGLNPKGVEVIAMSPGWVKVSVRRGRSAILTWKQTDMGGRSAMQEIDYSVACMLKTIREFDLSKGEMFKGFHGGTYQCVPFSHRGSTLNLCSGGDAVQCYIWMQSYHGSLSPSQDKKAPPSWNVCLLMTSKSSRSSLEPSVWRVAQLTDVAAVSVS
jgi:hypothetical protein